MCPAEVPLENAQEEILHHAKHAEENWIMGVALTAALLAVLAAVTALMAEHNANEAMIKRIKSSDQWAFYQAKGIKAGVLQTRNDVLAALGKPVKEGDQAKLARYEGEQKEIKADAETHERESEVHLQRHVRLSYGVTMFQVGIAISAISVLTRRKAFWYLAGVFGAIGAVLLTYGLVA
jgi:hypothetical protein